MMSILILILLQPCIYCMQNQKRNMVWLGMQCLYMNEQLTLFFLKKNLRYEAIFYKNVTNINLIKILYMYTSYRCSTYILKKQQTYMVSQKRGRYMKKLSKYLMKIIREKCVYGSQKWKRNQEKLIELGQYMRTAVKFAIQGYEVLFESFKDNIKINITYMYIFIPRLGGFKFLANMERI